MTLRATRRASKAGILASAAACGVLVGAPGAGLCASYDAPKTAAQPAAGSCSAGAAMKLAQSLPPASDPLPGSRPDGAAPPSVTVGIPAPPEAAAQPSVTVLIFGSRPEASSRSPITEILPGMRPLSREQLQSLSDVLPGTRQESVAPKITDLFHGF